MKLRHKLGYFIILFLIFSGAKAEKLPLSLLQLPSGFHIDIYAQIPGVRSLTLGPDNIVFAGTISEGKVYAILPNQNATEAAKILLIANDLTMPNGVAYLNNALYVAENQQVIRYDNIAKHLLEPPKPETVIDLPHRREHGWRYLRVGPDGQLYIAIGAPCNVCLEDDPQFGTIMRFEPDGSNLQIYASGIRNSVGFDWDPTNKDLWFTDNGRDWLGDNLPPDELNHATKPGLHFGFPYYYGNNKLDPHYGKLAPPQDFVPATLGLPAHVAALGMVFYTGKQFPKDYIGQIILAEHGSWNRSRKVGYQLTLVTLDESRKPVKTSPFVTGWLQGQRAWGRPVDVLQMPDGALLVSDDYNGVIYRISYAQSG